MKSNIFLWVILIVSLFLGLSACNNHKIESSYTENKHNNNNNTIVEKKNTKQELVNLYTQAISAFIQAAYIKDKISYDTLYFGKHIYGQADDFPSIELPESIEKTHIRLVTPELGQKIQLERKSRVYINLMAWIEERQAEFLFVVFSNGAAHQYDYTIRFNYNQSNKKFELAQISYQNYAASQADKATPILLYKDGKYILNQ